MAGQEERIIMSAKAFDLTEKVLLVDTGSIDDAIEIATNYRKVAQQFIDSTHLQNGNDSMDVSIDKQSGKTGEAREQKNYRQGIHYLGKAIKLLDAFHSKYPHDKDLLKKLSEIYSDLAFYSMFLKNRKDYEDVLDLSKTAIHLDTSNHIAYTNLALGYMFTRNYAKADSIYSNFHTLKLDFCSDFDALTRERIIPVNDAELQKQIMRIRRKTCGK